ncbi:MAG: DsrE/DsrF/DrsH-like family protein [Betaproteobacteria bacterium]|nr:DsrE/DsrF/DrsH-like family protein [Betaproteobacteria bacterium]
MVEARVLELTEHRLEEIVRNQVSTALATERQRSARPKRLAIVASKGTLDGAYPPLILATAAAALDMEVAVYFTFFGLHILKKHALKQLQIVPMGNPAFPVPVPNMVGALPGMTRLATAMMKHTIKQKQIASVPDLMDLAKEAGVKLWPCQMTMDMMGITREELIEGVDEPVGAATFLEYASDADVTLYV